MNADKGNNPNICVNLRSRGLRFHVLSETRGYVQAVLRNAECEPQMNADERR